MAATQNLTVIQSDDWRLLLAGAGGITIQSLSGQFSFAVTGGGKPTVSGHNLAKSFGPVTWRTVAGEEFYVRGSGILAYTLEG